MRVRASASEAHAPAAASLRRRPAGPCAWSLAPARPVLLARFLSPTYPSFAISSRVRRGLLLMVKPQPPSPACRRSGARHQQHDDGRPHAAGGLGSGSPHERLLPYAGAPQACSWLSTLILTCPSLFAISSKVGRGLLLMVKLGPPSPAEVRCGARHQ